MRPEVEPSVVAGKRGDKAMPPGLSPAPGTAGVTGGDHWALQKLYDAAGRPPIRVELWNGVTIGPRAADATATLHVHNRRALFKLLAFPDYHLGACYTSGEVHVEGSLVNGLEALYRSLARAEQPGPLQQQLLHWLYRPQQNTLAASRQNIHHHYNIGNAFYRLWLDEQLVYTCAYFRRPDDTLEQAQIDKMDHVCRKLRLRPDDRVVEAGCGWGALALHMARHYGVSVDAYNISREQIRHARERAQALGLQDRVRFVEDDYRNIHGGYDVFVSIGMLEHVGPEHFAAFGNVIDRGLRPNGRGLIHFIGRTRPTPLNPWIERHIFPGGYPPALSEVVPMLERATLSVLDVENLRLHYAKTLEHWLARFDAATEQVRAMFDDRFARAWRFYLAGSVAAFRSGDLQLFQLLFNRGGNNDVAWTREYLYE
jgi:cyclopropane-fatty-acyl-phospholipid synthase